MYIVNNEGVKVEFKELPNRAYSAMGVNGSTRGDLFLMIPYCTLTPIFNDDGKHVNLGEELGGKEFLNGQWV